MTSSRIPLRWIAWPLIMIGVVLHMALGVLAVVELARLEWLPSAPWEFTAVSVVTASVVLAMAGAARVAWPMIRGGRALRRLLGSAGGPLPKALLIAAEPLGIADKMQLIVAADALAVTHGLIRPRIVVSTGLVEALDAGELTAVLVHERHHLRRRDPLRLLIERLLAGYAWYLPFLSWWTRRLAVRRELAADSAATVSAGVAAVAGALLKLADRGRPATMVAINPAGDLPERIAHLEGSAAPRRTRTGWLLAGASLANLIGLSAAVICCTGLGVAMAGGMT